MALEIERLGPADVAGTAAANRLFSEVFGDEGYHGHPPSNDYLRQLLADDKFIALVARQDQNLVGALAGYELVKFEAERSEIYIYDLAVRGPFRRLGIATALIERLKVIAREKGAWMIFVQADPPDKPAVALYRKLGVEERVLHYDINPAGDR